MLDAYDPRPLMRQLARMANMDAARIRRMVLVLDVDDAPKLYAESFFDEKRMESELVATELEVQPDMHVTVSPGAGLELDVKGASSESIREKVHTK